jgi:hypothetical protein
MYVQRINMLTRGPFEALRTHTKIVCTCVCMYMYTCVCMYEKADSTRCLHGITLSPQAVFARVVAGILERIVDDTCLKLFHHGQRHQTSCTPDKAATCVTDSGALCEASLLGSAGAGHRDAANDAHAHASGSHADQSSPAHGEGQDDRSVRTHHDANDMCAAASAAASIVDDVKGAPAPLEMIG